MVYDKDKLIIKDDLMSNEKEIEIIGAGLAGCEVAFTLANAGFRVNLHEMKPTKRTPAHSYDGFAELVCSNSLKAARLDSAAGMLKEEMRRLGSVVMEAAEHTAVAAGGALAVNRTDFSDYITNRIKAHPFINCIEGEVESIDYTNPNKIYVIASGPLTSDSLSSSIAKLINAEYLSFYDAAAPIVLADTVDRSVAFTASRYNKDASGEVSEAEGDYINCPMNKEQYTAFYEALVAASPVPLKEWEKGDKDLPLEEEYKVYQGCMPIEVMAKRGMDTMRYGPLKPVGLTDPATGRRPWAVVQLRKENKAGSMYNLVGFQTNLRFPEQKRVFSMIPGLENAEFVRFGVMHRNTFIDSPRLLNKDLALKAQPNVYFAGQITGVEGYCESAASGIYVGTNIARSLKGEIPLRLSNLTMLGALIGYITDETVTNFQPMGCNMGVLPPLDQKIRDKKLRYKAIAERGLAAFVDDVSLISDHPSAADEVGYPE